ncbi:MAG: PHP domain-containing protein, partial [Saprospiraceae bacterium]|nr:PHP domain-containing protein [Saprospiraceae bacterium]
MKFLVIPILGLFSILATGQSIHQHGRVAKFPPIPGYLSLSCDFHIHTVFSDGSVWPDIRVQEALKDSLDAVSMTEHLEYQPHKDDIPHPDRNRAYHLELEEAQDHDLLIVPGSEITRSEPV